MFDFNRNEQTNFPNALLTAVQRLHVQALLNLPAKPTTPSPYFLLTNHLRLATIPETLDSVSHYFHPLAEKHTLLAASKTNRLLLLTAPQCLHP